MKNNVIYINFSYQYKKKKFLTLLEKLFNWAPTRHIAKQKSKSVINIQHYDKKHVL